MSDTSTTLKDSVKKEISRFAATAYSENGVSLYDAYRTTSRDDGTLDGYIQRSKTAICARMPEIATIGEDDNVSITAPDKAGSDSIIEIELDTFIIMKSCALWLEEKGAPEAERYEARAAVALENANRLIKTRKAPTRS